MTEENQQKLKSALAELLSSSIKESAGLIIALGVIGGAVWYFLQDKVDNYVESKIQAATGLNIQPPFIEFRGSGKIGRAGPYRPGARVPVTYLLKRNLPCETEVEVNFISGKTGTVDTSYTYIIPAVRSSVSDNFNLFTVNVRLPSDLPDGKWAYSPVLNPKDCNGAKRQYVPISDFFEVRR